MVRYFLLAILVAVAAAQNENTQNVDEQLSNADATLYKQLKLTPEQIKAANAAENQTAHYMAYMHALGVKKETSCAGLFINAKNIKFTLYSMPSQPITWTADQTNKNLTPYFDANLPTQILIHGRGDAPEIFKPADLAFTYGVRGNKMNIITVDWSAYSDCAYLLSVFFTMPQLSTVISDMIKNTLVASSGANYDQMRLTGHGMGAHAAGFTARKLPQQISRITALDPAGELYNYLPEEMRLKKGDAKFLDVIMTNRNGYGMKDLIGDINFLPSGGRIQKACLLQSDSMKDACSHEIAVEYFLESVDKGVRGFLAKNADSWAAFIAKKSTTKFSEVMGENVSQKRFGNFYLDVNAEKPYSKSVIGAYMVSNSGLEKAE